jgi:hypothetical protein
MSFPADGYTLVIHKHARFSKDFWYYPDGLGSLPVDWSTYAGATGQVRTVPGGELLFDLTVTLNQATSGANRGKITLAADSTDTDVDAVDGQWDIIVDPPGSPTREFLMGGRVKFKETVTA